MAWLHLGFQDMLRRARRALRYVNTNEDFAFADEGMNAVLFAALAAEAFPTDFLTMLAMFKPAPDHLPEEIQAMLKIPKELQAARRILTQLEEERVQTRVKYQMLYYILAHESLHTGAQPYQDFDFLLTLRNEIVHPKTSLVERSEKGIIHDKRSEKFLRMLEQKGLIVEGLRHAEVEWQRHLNSRLAGLWAYNSVAKMVSAICLVVPDCKFKESYISTLQQRLSQHPLETDD